MHRSLSKATFAQLSAKLVRAALSAATVSPNTSGKMAVFTAAKDFLAQQHLAPLLSQVQQNLVSLNKWDTVGKALQVRTI